MTNMKREDLPAAADANLVWSKTHKEWSGISLGKADWHESLGSQKAMVERHAACGVAQ
jgi:hypothetical protein